MPRGAASGNAARPAVSERDRWLAAAEDELARACVEERFRSGGPGGQHRQKNATGIRLRHAPSGITAAAAESRSLAENRRRALRRLRLRIACEVRAPLAEPFVWPPGLAPYVAGGVVRIDRRNPAYPQLAALALDALAAAEGSYAAAARMLGLSTSQLLRLLEREPEVQRAAAAIRAASRGGGG